MQLSLGKVEVMELVMNQAGFAIDADNANCES
jgi:hypothetical protein